MSAAAAAATASAKPSNGPGRSTVSSLTDLSSVRDYLSRIGAEAVGMRKAAIRVKAGSYARDIARIVLNKDGTITAKPSSFEPNDLEAQAIKNEYLTVLFPRSIPVTALRGADIPKQIKESRPDEIFEFKNVDGTIAFVEIRKRNPDGTKDFYIWSYWSDDKWRPMQPDGRLIPYGLEHLKDNTTVFIHEGPHVARAMHEMTRTDDSTPEDRERLANHPWGLQLGGACHLGWTGGAFAASNTDWSVLKSIETAYIVPDNDEAGRGSVSTISQALDCVTWSIETNDDWPGGWDLADPFPTKMFRKLDGQPRYVGPSFYDCKHPATWATDEIPQTKGKPILRLRSSFTKTWFYVEGHDVYACAELPDRRFSEAVFNKVVSRYSHTKQTANLLHKASTSVKAKLAYRPDNAGRVITDFGQPSLNLHVPSNIVAIAGNTAPWLEFLDYMFPDPQERDEIKRWCATIIAQPQIRIQYGILLVTETQGIGKTTLGSEILAPIIGRHNTSWPSESDITSDFNSWAANKRLVVVNEIYAGHSFKAYNRLKSVITDADVTVNEKYERAYTVQNWCHAIACSNSLRALRMQETDRRWFYPKMTEVPWRKEKFAEFYSWIASGGLSVIKHWAQTYNHYIRKEEQAPMTSRKRELINASKSEGAIAALDLGEAITLIDEPIALAMKDIVAHIRHSTQARVFDSDLELRKEMALGGAFIFNERIKCAGTLQHVVLNAAAQRMLETKIVEGGDALARNFVRSIVTPVARISESDL